MVRVMKFSVLVNNVRNAVAEQDIRNFNFRRVRKNIAVIFDGNPNCTPLYS